MLPQRLHICLACGAKTGGVSKDGFLLPSLQHHGFQPPGSHHTPQTSTGRRPRRAAFPIRDLHGRIQITPLPGRTDAENGYIVPIPGAQHVAGIVGAAQCKLRSVFQPRPLRPDHQHLQPFRLSRHHNAAKTKPGQCQPGGSPRVGLLDRSRQRAFAAHRNTARTCGKRSGQQAVAYHQPVVRSLRIACRFQLGQKQGGDQPPPSEQGIMFGNVLTLYPFCSHIHAKQFHFRTPRLAVHSIHFISSCQRSHANIIPIFFYQLNKHVETALHINFKIKNF